RHRRTARHAATEHLFCAARTDDGLDGSAEDELETAARHRRAAGNTARRYVLTAAAHHHRAAANTTGQDIELAGTDGRATHDRARLRFHITAVQARRRGDSSGLDPQYAAARHRRAAHRSATEHLFGAA